ncbi:ASC domain containing protein, partial [Asbolus verrucosus]
KYPGFHKSLRYYFHDFGNRTSLHGFQYISDERTTVERLWLSVIFCISFAACVILINDIWIKWEQSPTLINFASQPTPHWKIPFLAVTICAENKINKQKFSFSDHLQKVFNTRNVTSYLKSC